jgi:integrase
MVRVRLKYISADIDRHGNVRYYFRKRGVPKKVRLPGRPGDEAFRSAYEALLAGKPLLANGKSENLPQKATPDSLRWLCKRYLESPEFKRLEASTRRNRERTLSTICDQPLSPGSALKVGDAPFAEMTAKAVRCLRDRKADTPEAANVWLKALKAVFKWAIEVGYCHQNPTRDVPKFRSASEGFHTWTQDEVAAFERTHPIGSMARLALALLLYTGQRRSDVILFGPQHVKDGSLRFTQQKNRNSNPVTLEIPVLPVLADVIKATPSRHLTFLVSKYGKPFTVGGFGNRMREWCNAAGLPHCSAHGLRKAGAVQAAENGATPHQLMAIFGWRDIKQAEKYTRKANQKKLARDSMHLIGGSDKS